MVALLVQKLLRFFVMSNCSIRLTMADVRDEACRSSLSPVTRPPGRICHSPSRQLHWREWAALPVAWPTPLMPVDPEALASFHRIENSPLTETSVPIRLPESAARTVRQHYVCGHSTRPFVPRWSAPTPTLLGGLRANFCPLINGNFP